MNSFISKPRFWRFASPSCLLVGILLFPLPWLEVCCRAQNGPTTAVAITTGTPIPKDGFTRIREFFEDLFSPKVAVLVSQSGLQASTGDYSEELRLSKSETDPPKRIAIPPAPLMFVYLFVLCLGAALGFLAASTFKRRVGIAAMCGATACALLWFQTAMGFPLANLLDAEKLRAIQEGKESADEYVRFTSWYYLSHLAALGPTGLLIAEHRMRRKRRLAQAPCGDLSFDIPAAAGYNISETSPSSKDSSNGQELENYPG